MRSLDIGARATGFWDDDSSAMGGKNAAATGLDDPLPLPF
jgi:hypothetical protein